ncbi:glycine cleavage H-protein-domain-containing protein [Syncephalis plumigaleata]|nr:glycine cleavage H-protein-domain-containing protein [Syncephalis plumigaleata]
MAFRLVRSLARCSTRAIAPQQYYRPVTAAFGCRAYSSIKYTPEHEWACMDGDTVTMGLTEYAQKQLGEIVFVDTGASGIGSTIAKGDAIGTVESVKAVSEVYAPVSGEILEINGELDGNPELVNEAPYSEGWLFKIKVSDPSEFNSLLDKEPVDEGEE